MSEWYPKSLKFAAPIYDIQNFIYNRLGLEKPKAKDRKLLQFLGTDWGREKSESLWTDIWRKEARTYLFKFADNKRGVVLNDDCRFLNEAQLVKEMRGAIVNVEAPYEMRKARCQALGCGCLDNPETDSHPSEQGLPADMIYATVYNNEDLSELRLNLRYLLTDGVL